MKGLPVFTRLSAGALFKFLLFQMRRLFDGGIYLRAVLFKKIIAFVEPVHERFKDFWKWSGTTLSQTLPAES